MLRDRGVLTCGTIAVVLGLAGGWWNSAEQVISGDYGDSTYWVSRVLWLAPYALALVAVLVSGRPGSGVLVAVAALLAAFLGVELATGIADLSRGVSLLGVLAYALNVVALVPADMAAAVRDRPFDARSGARVGLVCGLVLAAVAFLWVLPRVVDLPAWYVLGGYVFPPVALATVGLLAGAAAAVPSGAPARTQSTRP